jgi:hypothetical protein
VLTVAYSGDANYGASSNTATLKVTTIADALALSYSTTASPGQSYSVAVAITPAIATTLAPTGTLTLYSGTTILTTINLAQTKPNSQGQYVLTAPNGLPSGATSLRVAYSGDSNFASTSATTSTITTSGVA